MENKIIIDSFLVIPYIYGLQCEPLPSQVYYNRFVIVINLQLRPVKNSCRKIRAVLPHIPTRMPQIRARTSRFADPPKKRGPHSGPPRRAQAF